MKAANIEWRDGNPYACDYEDIYHSPDGVRETNQVFFEPAALARLLTSTQTLTIAELGLGTALNLAVLLERWQESSRPPLHFISCEQHPLSAKDWQQVVGTRRAAVSGYDALAPLYPPLVPGWHRRSLFEGRVTLSLFWGTGAAMLEELHGRQRMPVDLWLLDGFSPDRNPDLWAPALLNQLPRLSRPGTAVTTFTAAGRVRRALENGGFEMRRVDQLPFKHETLAGVLRDTPKPAHEADTSRTTDSDARQAAAWARARTLTQSQPVEIIGAGIAGASLARHLAESGIACIVFDAGPAPLGASHLPAIVAHTRLLADDSATARQRALAQLYSSHFLGPHSVVEGVQARGALQLAGDANALSKLRRVADRYADERWCRPVAHKDIEALTQGYAPKASREFALWCPQAWVVDPQHIVAALLAHPLISVRWQRPVDLRQPSNALRCLTVGNSVRNLPIAAALEIAPLGGQLDRYEVSPTPEAALVGAGYCVPAPGRSSALYLGGTYEYQPWAPGAATEANQRQLPTQPAPRWTGRYRSARLTTSDRQPIVGLAPQTNADPSGGTLLSLGFGSLGMTQAPLAAAVLASRLAGIVPPLSPAQESALSSERFVQRQQRRGPWRGNEPKNGNVRNEPEARLLKEQATHK